MNYLLISNPHKAVLQTAASTIQSTRIGGISYFNYDTPLATAENQGLEPQPTPLGPERVRLHQFSINILKMLYQHLAGRYGFEPQSHGFGGQNNNRYTNNLKTGRSREIRTPTCIFCPRIWRPVFFQLNYRPTLTCFFNLSNSFFIS